MTKRFMAVAILSAATTLLLFGCSPTANKDKLSDGTAGDISMAMTQMSNEGNTGLAKMTAGDAVLADTISYTGLVVLQPWTYDATSKWWSCSFTDSLADGRSFTFIDSLKFTDAASQAKTTMPGWYTSDGWTHIRYLSRHGLLGNTFNSRFEMAVVVTKGTDTTAIWNGTVTGTWNGLALRTTTVTNVERKFARSGNVHWWKFPSSGTIYIDNLLRTWTVTYTGNGGATAVVTRKSDNKQKTFTINIATGAENE